MILWAALVLVLLLNSFFGQDLMASDLMAWSVIMGVPIALAVVADRLLCSQASAAAMADGARLQRQQLAEKNQEFLVKLNQDALTGLHNRRSLDAFLGYYTQAREYRLQPLSIVMIDLDLFKLINDQYGHLTGDTVLQVLSRRWIALIRGSDLLARFGGDEFCLVLPNTTLPQAMMVAEKIRRATSDSAISVNDDGRKLEIPVSISLGVATADSAFDSPIKALLLSADQALYQAKAKGRNAIVGNRCG